MVFGHRTAGHAVHAVGEVVGDSPFAIRHRGDHRCRVCLLPLATDTVARIAAGRRKYFGASFLQNPTDPVGLSSPHSVSPNSCTVRYLTASAGGRYLLPG